MRIATSNASPDRGLWQDRKIGRRDRLPKDFVAPFGFSFPFLALGFELGFCREAFPFETGHHSRVIVNAG
jgi:hypothetical protein